MLKGPGELPVSWPLSGEEEGSGFRVSICVEVISPTSVDHYGWMRCLLHAAVFGDGRVWSLICCPDEVTVVTALVTLIWDCMPVVRTFAIKRCLRCVTSCRCCIERVYTYTRSALRPRRPAEVKRSAGLDYVAVSPSGLGGNAWACEFQSTQDGVNTCVVSSCGFGGAASLSVFQLWVQEGTTQSALTKACPRPVAKSFLHVGDVVVRRQTLPIHASKWHSHL